VQTIQQASNNDPDNVENSCEEHTVGSLARQRGVFQYNVLKLQRARRGGSVSPIPDLSASVNLVSVFSGIELINPMLLFSNVLLIVFAVTGAHVERYRRSDFVFLKLRCVRLTLRSQFRSKRKSDPSKY
jgi:hypothetical protein